MSVMTFRRQARLRPGTPKLRLIWSLVCPAMRGWANDKPDIGSDRIICHVPCHRARAADPRLSWRQRALPRWRAAALEGHRSHRRIPGVREIATVESGRGRVGYCHWQYGAEIAYFPVLGPCTYQPWVSEMISVRVIRRLARAGPPHRFLTRRQQRALVVRNRWRLGWVGLCPATTARATTGNGQHGPAPRARGNGRHGAPHGAIDAMTTRSARAIFTSPTGWSGTT